MGTSHPVSKDVGKVGLEFDNTLNTTEKKPSWLMRARVPWGRQQMGMWVVLTTPIKLGKPFSKSW